MKLLKVEAINFGSYSHIEFDYTDKGLALIYGATGSGKSTLQDLAPWTIFGITAKDGNADDIRSWNDLTNPTQSTISLLTKDNVIMQVVRIRGKSSQNDLYWTEGDNPDKIRGKDITETQKLLEARLGVSKELYIAAAYYNEFSPTGNFFSAKAKDRRELLENIANLEFPNTLSGKIVNGRKETRKAILSVSEELNKARGRSEELRRQKISSQREAESWSKNQERIIQDLKEQAESFEENKISIIKNLETLYLQEEANNKAAIEELENQILSLNDKLLTFKETCPECGQPNKEYNEISIKLDRSLNKLQNDNHKFTNKHKYKLEAAKASVNTFDTQIQNKLSESNPFIASISRLENEVPISDKLVTRLTHQQKELEAKHKALDHLSELVATMRGELLKHTIKGIEKETNRYLEDYFDSEIRVQFELSSDNIEVSIKKDGFDCNFKQLSKGQRCLLKLCFSVSIMEVATSRLGLQFNVLSFDEALDGLDTSLKTKAFNLFSELEKRHETILVVEHNDSIISLFTLRYRVTLISNESQITED